jgi:hypothetical protein
VLFIVGEYYSLTNFFHQFGKVARGNWLTKIVKKLIIFVRLLKMF